MHQLELIGGDSALIAEEMQKRKAELFPTDKQWDPNDFAS
jgi:hypothetical protein